MQLREHGDRTVEGTEALAEDRGGLVEVLEDLRAVLDLGRGHLQNSGERTPGLGLAVEPQQQLARRGLLRLIGDGAGQHVDRALAAVGAQQGLGEQHDDRRTLAAGRHLEATAQPRHGLGVLAPRHVQARERVEGVDRRLDGDDPAITGDRAVDVAEALLGQRGQLRPHADRAGVVADALEALAVLAQEVREDLRAGLGGEHRRERRERGVVARALLEVAPQGLDPAAALLDDADDVGDVEAQLELALRVGGARQLVVTQGQQLGVAVLGLEQVAEGAHGGEVARLLLHHAAVQRDRLAAVTELGVDRSGAQAHGLRGRGREGQRGAAREQVGGLAALARLVVQATELLHGPGDALLGAAPALRRQAAVPQRGGAGLQPAQDLARARGVAVEAERQLGGLVEVVEVVLALGGEGKQRVDELAVGGAALELREHLEALDVARHDRQRALQRRACSGRVVAVVAVPRRHPGLEERPGHVRQAGVGQSCLEGQGQAVPAGEGRGLGLDEREQRCIELAVGADLGDHGRGRGVPASDAGRHAHRPPQRVGVARLDRQHGVVGGERRLELAELVLERAGLGQAQLGAASRVADQSSDGFAVRVDGELPGIGLFGEADDVPLELAVAWGAGEGAAQQLESRARVTDVLLL